MRKSDALQLTSHPQVTEDEARLVRQLEEKSLQLERELEQMLVDQEAELEREELVQAEAARLVAVKQVSWDFGVGFPYVLYHQILVSASCDLSVVFFCDRKLSISTFKRSNKVVAARWSND